MLSYIFGLKDFPGRPRRRTHGSQLPSVAGAAASPVDFKFLFAGSGVNMYTMHTHYVPGTRNNNL